MMTPIEQEKPKKPDMIDELTAAAKLLHGLGWRSPFEVEALEGHVQAVKELHREVEGPGFTYCAECDRLSGGVFGACVYPCSTARALGVEG